MKKLLPIICLPIAFHAESLADVPARSGSLEFRAGVAWRQLGGTQVDPGLGAASGVTGFFNPNPASGSVDQNANRTYDDGFVNIGSGTVATGLTTNFGYDDNSQISPDSLTYTLSGGSALDTPGYLKSDDSTEAAPYLELVYTLRQSECTRFGFVLSASYSQFDTSLRSALTEFAVTTVDTYQTGGIILPGAPYSGSLSGPGPVIGNQPDAREYQLTPIGSRGYAFESDLDLYSVGLGVEFDWEPYDRVTVHVGSGLVVNYADWEARAAAEVLAGTATTSKNDADWLLGLYLKAGAGYQLSDALSLQTFARYDFNQDLDANVGPASFKTDLSGWMFGASFAYRF